MIDTGFLNEQDIAIVEEETKSSEIEGFVRFWDYNNIQLDGDFTTEEIKKLSAAMIRMELVHNSKTARVVSDSIDD